MTRPTTLTLPPSVDREGVIKEIRHQMWRQFVEQNRKTRYALETAIQPFANGQNNLHRRWEALEAAQEHLTQTREALKAYQQTHQPGAFDAH